MRTHKFDVGGRKQICLFVALGFPVADIARHSGLSIPTIYNYHREFKHHKDIVTMVRKLETAPPSSRNPVNLRPQNSPRALDARCHLEDWMNGSERDDLPTDNSARLM